MTQKAASDGGQHRMPPPRTATRAVPPRSARTRTPAPLSRRQQPRALRAAPAASHRAPTRPVTHAAGSVPRLGGGPPTEPPPVCRHPWEWPLTAAALLVTAVVLAAAGHTLSTAEGAALWGAGILFAGVPGTCWAASGLLQARQRAHSVRISPTQFPEAEHAIRRLSAQMGLECTPEAYVCQDGGRLRSWAGSHGPRRYIVVSSDLFEIGGRLRDPDALRFVVAHQLGHIAAGHTSFWLRTGTAAGRLVPVLGSSLSRAREYTADNYAHAHCPEGAHAIRLLVGGKHLYAQVNMSEMAERARTDRGPFLFLYNLLSSRPASTRRMAAIRDRTRAGRVFL
ncbi:M48 family metallopeptidase [Streptomonospora litoralis]|uniref:Protease HtpX n=1 Tax=Streptomonospora litoralis TaxID=2498135 RepID=A0A4P6PZ03_9ACTN|nr:M48 family metallopeptidase [Streptomonospora litoralis]QBI52121.1 Protease HtpX [Streptomonospora litoralis]